MCGFALLCLASPITNSVEVQVCVNTSWIWVVSILGRSARLQCLWLCQEVQRDLQNSVEAGDCARGIGDVQGEWGEEGLLLLSWNPGSNERLGEGHSRAGHPTCYVWLNSLCSTWPFISHFSSVCAHLSHVACGWRPTPDTFQFHTVGNIYSHD